MRIGNNGNLFVFIKQFNQLKEIHDVEKWKSFYRDSWVYQDVFF